MNPSKNNMPMAIGMVGVRGFGSYRRERLRETGLFQLVACYDRNPEIMVEVCKQESARAASSLQDLLATPGLEGLVISTGVDTHTQFALQAMEAGLHVFIEKPLCGQIEEVTALLVSRERTGRVIGSGHVNLQSDWIYRLTQQWIENGRLGAIVCYEENSSHSGGLEIKPGDWRGLRERNPGGMLLQCGVHSLHRLGHQFGPVDRVAAMMRYDANPNTQTADVANVLVRHQSGLVGTLNCYHTTAYCHELRIFGTKGNLYVDTQFRHAWFQPRKRGDNEERTEMPIPADPPLAACDNVISWHRAVRERISPCPSLEDAIEAVLPVFAAEKSDEEQRTVSLKELHAGLPQRVP